MSVERRELARPGVAALQHPSVGGDNVLVPVRLRVKRLGGGLLDEAERYLSGQEFELVRAERDVVTLG